MYPIKRYLFIVLTMLLITGRSFARELPDEERALELAQEFLYQTILSEKVHYAYDLLHPNLKREVSYDNLEEYMLKVRNMTMNCELFIVGSEHFEDHNPIAIHAKSQCKNKANTYISLSFIGDETKNYKITGLQLSDLMIEKRGLYNKYKKPHIVIDM